MKDKVAIVTGASKGIGRAIARRLSTDGMKITVAARSAELLTSLAAECPTEILPYACDLRLPDAPNDMVQTTIDRFGRLDLLVNCAGATIRGDFLQLSDADWQDGFALKFYGAVRASRAAWLHLQASKGCIINIIGIGGRTGSAEFAIGGAVNAALMNLTKVLADRGVRDGVRVNAINPGSIATERLKRRITAYAADHQLSEEDAARDMAARLGVSRFGTPDEIAHVVAFLSSPEAAYCQGLVTDVDGGQTRTL